MTSGYIYSRVICWCLGRVRAFGEGPKKELCRVGVCV